jgi:hypothetical protein
MGQHGAGVARRPHFHPAAHAEARPDVVKLAKALARKKPKGGRLSLRAISAEMADRGVLNERGRPFNPKSVAAMLSGG